MGKPDGLLKQKLDDEYNRYIDHVRGLPVGKILQNIEEIAAMMDVYHYLTEYGDLDNKETAYILSADSPLRELRDRWLNNEKDISDSLSEALWYLCDTLELSEDDEDEWEG
jgi:hypothetical protein